MNQPWPLMFGFCTSYLSVCVHVCRLLGRCHPLDPVTLEPQGVPEELADQVCNAKHAVGTYNCGEGYVCLNIDHEAADVSHSNRDSVILTCTILLFVSLLYTDLLFTLLYIYYLGMYYSAFLFIVIVVQCLFSFPNHFFPSPCSYESIIPLCWWDQDLGQCIQAL